MLRIGLGTDKVLSKPRDIPKPMLTLFTDAYHMGQVAELWLSCYLALLSIDSKTR